MTSAGWKHDAAQQEIFKILSIYFNRVTKEFEVPVPNPERTMGDLKARSTLTYYLDVYAEDPIWRKIHSLKYYRIGIEIDGEVGHKRTKKQHKRDQARTKRICEFRLYEGIAIFRFDPECLVGKGFRDPRLNFTWRPTLSPEEIFQEIGLVARKISC